MNILVTGGAGYIGSHTCKALHQNGHKVIVYDNLSTGFRSLARWGEFVHGDILDEARLRACMRAHKPDGLIHFAASAYVGESVLQPGMYFRNNVNGTLTLLEAMRLEEVPAIVVSSSCAVYGQPAEMPISETCPKAPVNPYGATKLFMEQMLADYHTAHGLNWVSLRYFNAAGADPDGDCGELHQPESHLIPRVFMAARHLIPALEIFGNDYPTPDGTCVRDYVHVSDLANAHMLALEYLSHGQSRAFNVGTGTGFSVLEILEAARQATGVPIPHLFTPRRPGDPPQLVANPTLIEQELHWKPKHSTLPSLINTAWQWFNDTNFGRWPKNPCGE